MKRFSNILWGVIFIVVGIIVALNLLGIADINIFFDGWWTLFIIVPCAVGLFSEKEKTGNIIGLVIGLVLLLGAQDVIDFSMIWKLMFPAILIIIGVSFIFKDAFGFYSDQIFLCHDGHSGLCQTAKFPAGSSYSWKPDKRTQ